MTLNNEDLPEAPQDDVVVSGADKSSPDAKAAKTDKPVRKKVLTIAGVALAGYILYALYVVFLTPDRNIRQIYLVPEDAALIVQSNDPIGDWKKLSGSEPWRCLMQARAFAEISQNVGMLDSLVNDNRRLLSLAGRREMTISLHKVRATDFDFLIIVDLQKVSKVNLVRDNFEQVFKMAGFHVTARKYKGVDIIEARNKQTGDILSSAIVDNHFVTSFSPRLVEASVDSKDNPKVGLDNAYLEVERSMAGRGIARVFVNYEYLPAFLSISLGQNEYVDIISNSMSYAGLFLSANQERLEFAGSTLSREGEQNPYMEALLNSGRHKMKAHDIISARTALYANIGFDDPLTFAEELERAISQNDSTLYESYKSSKKKLENYLGLSLYDNFLGWMAGEFAFTQSEPGLLGREPEVILAIRAKNINDARQNMALIEKKVKVRTPINVKAIEYHGYEIKYIELKGFFKLFFGSLFDKFDKPYYTYLDDYLVMSNNPASLLSFLADYTEGNLLRNEEGFNRALAQVEPNSTLFLYTDMHKFYPQLKSMLSVESWNNLQNNGEVLRSFPQWTFQLSAGRQNTSIGFVMNYQRPIKDESMPIVEDQEIAQDTVTQTETELMNELQRFYVEKFEGNILRDYYSGGALKNESEVKNGRRNGRYREFYENGTLKVHGKYSDNLPKGTWKYYTPQGKFDRKERY